MGQMNSNQMPIENLNESKKKKDLTIEIGLLSNAFSRDSRAEKALTGPVGTLWAQLPTKKVLGLLIEQTGTMYIKYGKKRTHSPLSKGYEREDGIQVVFRTRVSPDQED